MATERVVCWCGAIFQRPVGQRGRPKIDCSPKCGIARRAATGARGVPRLPRG